MSYLNIHVLRSVPASNLNRDDTGSPKTMLYGERNAKRIRLSSQSIKRGVKEAMRTSGSSAGSVLTRSFPQTFVDIFMSAGYSEKVALGYAKHFVDSLFSMKTESKTVKDITTHSVPTAFSIGQSEYDEIVTAVTLYAADKDRSRTVLPKTIEAPTIDALAEQIVGSENFEVNAFGRMNATKPSMNVEATFAVAHGFTVGNAPSQSDYLIAKDDITESSGAAAMVDSEFGTGTFYEYATINVDEFLSRQPESRRASAYSFISDFIRTFATTLPSGKQNSNAAFTPADVVLITITDAPASLASAFFTPIISDVWEKSTIALAEESAYYLSVGYDVREFWFSRPKLAKLVEGRENSEVFSSLSEAISASVGAI